MEEMNITMRRGTGLPAGRHHWVADFVPADASCPLAVGAATRPYSAGEANGDAFVIKHGSESLLVGVIDGLGHGPYAWHAALTATRYVENDFDQPLADIFHGAGMACRATRGVMMALARFEWSRGRLSFASMGNVLARVFPDPAGFAFTTQRGVVGHSAPGVAVTEHPWPANHLLILHSDGLRSQWRWNDFPGLPEETPAVIARQLLHDLAKESDDATALAVRS